MYIYDGKVSEWSPTVSDYSRPLAQSAGQFHGLPCLYGKWCGPLCGGPGAPIDDVDQCCQAHDQCYADRGYFDCRCNRDLMACVAPKINFNSRKGLAALGVWKAFKDLPCIPRTGRVAR